MRTIGRTCASALGLFLAGLAVRSVPASPPEAARVFATGLTLPVAITAAPGDNAHLFVVDLNGKIDVIDSATGAVSPTPFLDIRDRVLHVSDGGLLGLAFDPQYATNGLFYVFYNSAPNPPNDRVLARFHATPGAAAADVDSGVTLLRYPRTIGHNGGWIGFRPTDGYLYMSSGDGGSTHTYDAFNNAQTIVGQLQGKTLRIDVHGGDDFPDEPERNYHIPPTNPFVGGAGDGEIWSYGHRNPWRCSFDRATGDFYIAENGEDSWEEINYESAADPGGHNYGWSCMEGNHCLSEGHGCTCGDPSLTGPAFEYDHTQGQSIIGGYVYRGAAIPQLQGLYLFGDFVNGRFWTLRMVGGVATDLLERTADLVLPGGGTISTLSAFGEDNAGELYMTSYASGVVYKIIPRAACAADFNGVNGLNVQDIFDFLSAWFSADPRADFNGAGGVNVQDIFDFLTAWFAGCP
jgi:glucose/arabinose dehydrogenase